jgi:acetyl esterase/lipase
MKWFWNQYTTNESDRVQITASPLRATVEQLKGLPPALVMCGEFDVLRDEGEAYAHKLIAAGVRTTALRFHGTIHDFVLLHAIKDTPATRGAMTQAIATLKAELGG